MPIDKFSADMVELQSGKSVADEIGNLLENLADIVLNVKDFPIQVPEANDTGRIQRALDALKATGGKLLFPDGTYNVSAQLKYVFENDVRIILMGGTNSLIKSTYTGDQLYISSTSNVGDVEIYNLNFDGSNSGEYWDTNTRSQAITVVGCRSIKIKSNKIKDLYGTGIMCLNNISVDIANNILLNVRGYNVNGDNYGDGIYVGQNTKIISIKHNYIKNELSSTKRCGRIGITLEFDVANATVERNYVYGYNRGIHSESTMGGHTIKHNTIEACFVPIIFIGEKGFVETVVKNNSFSNKGFVNTGNIVLSFKNAAVTMNINAVGYKPKIKFISNFVEVLNENNVTNNSGLTHCVQINLDNVTFEDNIVQVDSTITGKDFFSSSRKNVKINRNTLTNVGVISIGYTTDCEFTFNDVTCASVVNARANNLRFNNNKISPQEGLTVLGSILYDRPQGTFNDNVIEKYGAETINNTSYASNAYYLEVSGNQFIKKTVDSPALPTKVTTNPEVCDVLYTRRPNTITDELNSANNQNLTFYSSHRVDDGRKIIMSLTTPANKTWKKGDVIYNTNPSAGGYVGWICVADGTPGTWKGFGLIQA